MFACDPDVIMFTPMRISLHLVGDWHKGGNAQYRAHITGTAPAACFGHVRDVTVFALSF